MTVAVIKGDTFDDDTTLEGRLSSASGCTTLAAIKIASHDSASRSELWTESRILKSEKSVRFVLSTGDGAGARWQGKSALFR